MTTEENTARIIEAFGKISKVFASMESFTGNISLSKPELLTLESVSKQKELTMSKLAKNLDIGFSTATSIIDRLIEKKLVARKRNHGDRRVVKVFLSKEGEKIVSSYQEQKKISFKKMIEFLTEGEQESFVLVLEKIANKMQKEDENQI
jgi:DNA-binding MarR family transcriptional regulator